MHTDFKAGLSPINNLPLKWSYDDIMNGYKLLDNNIKFKFVIFLIKNQL